MSIKPRTGKVEGYCEMLSWIGNSLGDCPLWGFQKNLLISKTPNLPATKVITIPIGTTASATLSATLICDGVTPHGGFPLTYITNAMKLFRQRNIDAFMHLGDMAHRGKNVEVQYHRDIFDKFFPRGVRSSDKRNVEKLLVVGNLELFGNAVGGTGAWAPNIWKDPVERAKHVLCADLPRYWEQIWGEKYEECWHKEVNGYHFFGRHWETAEMKLAEFINSKAEECSLKGTRPFFILFSSLGTKGKSIGTIIRV